MEVLTREAAKNQPSLPDGLQEQMESAYHLMVEREICQVHCREQIEEALSKAGIHYAILKGGILRDDYPIPFSRFMSDLDFYIRPEDRSTIRSAIEAAGGVLKGNESGDEQFSFWDKVGVEFHGRLLYRKHRSGVENYPAWSFVDESRNRLAEEGYALNLLGHAVHDLAGGGPGIRYILDLWIYRNRHQPQPEWEIVNDRLRQDGIYTAAQNLLDLSEYLFGSGEETPLMLEMADYVLKGGLYGDYGRGLANQAARGNAVAKQVFRNRAEFENRYPWLKKYPFLLPLAWAIRGFRSLKTNKNAIRRWYRGMARINKSDLEMQRERQARFGL